MSCPHCPHCKSGVPLGGLFSSLDQPSTEKQPEEKRDPPKLPVRGKAREYSKAFEIAWKAYPVRAQKFEAFGVWKKVAKEMGENELLPLIMHALVWQKKGWLKDADWYKPPYFERYLKRRKWEDEPPMVAAPAQRAPDPGLRAVDTKVAEYRATKPLTPEQRDEIRRLADLKAVGNG